MAKNGAIAHIPSLALPLKGEGWVVVNRLRHICNF